MDLARKLQLPAGRFVAVLGAPADVDLTGLPVRVGRTSRVHAPGPEGAPAHGFRMHPAHPHARGTPFAKGACAGC